MSPQSIKSQQKRESSQSSLLPPVSPRLSPPPSPYCGPNLEHRLNEECTEAFNLELAKAFKQSRQTSWNSKGSKYPEKPRDHGEYFMMVKAILQNPAMTDIKRLLNHLKQVLKPSCERCHSVAWSVREKRGGIHYVDMSMTELKHLNAELHKAHKKQRKQAKREARMTMKAQKIPEERWDTCQQNEDAG